MDMKLEMRPELKTKEGGEGGTVQLPADLIGREIILDASLGGQGGGRISRIAGHMIEISDRWTIDSSRNEEGGPRTPYSKSASFKEPIATTLWINTMAKDFWGFELV